ncbi:MAG: hypothetical protein K2L22_10845 [Muribaculaceae bacterium]|nr:hypothetical protein [Muribaculaceae bacterium]
MRIGKLKIGLAPLSMVVLFIVLSIFAILAAVRQARPEWPMPLSSLIIINESMALLATLVYGIILHLIMAFLGWYRSSRT